MKSMSNKKNIVKYKQYYEWRGENGRYHGLFETQKEAINSYLKFNKNINNCNCNVCSVRNNKMLVWSRSSLP